MGIITRSLTLLSLSVWLLGRFRVNLRETAAQYYEAGWRSILFVSVTMGFIGMIGVYQIASQMAKMLPEYSALGAGSIQMAIREMGPVMAGLLLATRVGTGIAAELGSMKVTDQIDAMKLSSVDPVELLVLPRLLAGVMACISLTVLACVVSITTGMLVAYTGFSVLPDTFLSLRFVTMSDVTMSLTKSCSFGLVVPLISCACGLEARGGSEGVGRATTEAVVWSSFAVIVLDAVISVWWELVW